MGESPLKDCYAITQIVKGNKTEALLEDSAHHHLFCIDGMLRMPYTRTK